MRELACIFVVTLFSVAGFTHGGHDHGPGSVQPPKGGVIRSLETIHLELVTLGQELKIFIYDKDLKPLDVSKYPASATVLRPRTEGDENLNLIPKKDHWEASYDSKGIHRYTIHFKITQGSHEDLVKFNVEPK